jgi:hypothetical protein
MSRISWPQSLAPLPVSLALALCSCATVAPVKKGTPATLAVAIPTTCERILTPVPLADVDAHTDARVAFERADNATITANEGSTPAAAALRACARSWRRRRPESEGPCLQLISTPA